MPQVRGAATWLSNIRQPVPDRAIRLDNSQAHIENMRLERVHLLTLERIHANKHRVRADREYDIGKALEEARHLLLLTKAIEISHVDKVFGKGYKKSGKSGGVKVKKTNMLTLSLPEPVTQVGKDREEEAVTPPSSRRNTFHFKPASPSTLAFHDVAESLTDNAGELRPWSVPVTKQTKLPEGYDPTKPVQSARTTHCSRSDKGAIVLPPSVTNPKPRPEYANSRPQTKRAKTAVDGQKLSIQQLLAKVEELKNRPKSSICEGRSFQELKELTHIDNVAEAEVEARRNNIKMRREMARQIEESALNKRIGNFLNDLSDMKNKNGNSKQIKFSFP